LAEDVHSREILEIIDNVSSASKRIDELSAKVDVIGQITRTYAELGVNTKDYHLLELALDRSNKIPYDYRRIIEQTHIAPLLLRFGRRIQAINLLERCESDVRKIKDISLKVESMLEICEKWLEIGEREKCNELIGRVKKVIRMIPENLLEIRIHCDLLLYRFYELNGFPREANSMFGIITDFLNMKLRDSTINYLLREFTNTLLAVAEKSTTKKNIYFEMILALLEKYPEVEDIHILHREILKAMLNVNDHRWLEGQIERIIKIIESIKNQKTKMELIYLFLLKAYKEDLVIDSKYLDQFIADLDKINEECSSPSRFISYQLMRLHLVAIFKGLQNYYEELESFIKSLLRDSRFRKNLPDRIAQALLTMVELFNIIKPVNVEILRKCIDLADYYAFPDVKDVVLKEVYSAFVKYGDVNKDTSLLESLIQDANKIETIDNKILVLLEIVNVLHKYNPNMAREIIEDSINKLHLISSVQTRIKTKMLVARALIINKIDIAKALKQINSALLDTNSFLIRDSEKAVAFCDIISEAKNIYEKLYKEEEERRHQQYNKYISMAREYLDKKSKEDIEKSINLYIQARNLLNENKHKYEYLWVSDQINKLKNYLENFSELKEFEIEDKSTDYIKERYNIKKSEIKIETNISWYKKRELNYSVRIKNDSKFTITQLNVRIKKIAKEFLENTSELVQSIHVLKRGGTFTCEFTFVALKDIIPDGSIEAEINLYDPINEITLTIPIEPPKTNSGYRFFMPKSIKVSRFEKLKQKFSKQTHEIAVNFNIYLTWKKLIGFLKNIPFKIIQIDHNDIASNFFGVVRLYAESRWSRKRKNATLVQIIVSGDINGDETNIKLEFFLQDPAIIHTLLKLFQEDIEIWRCPNQSCNEPLDREQIHVNNYGICKYCWTIFYTEANLKKIDKPARLRIVNLEELLNDEKSIQLIESKIKKIQKEEVDKILNTIKDENKSEFKEKLENLIEGKTPSKEFIQESIQKGNEHLIQAILLV